MILRHPTSLYYLFLRCLEVILKTYYLCLLPGSSLFLKRHYHLAYSQSNEGKPEHASLLRAQRISILHTLCKGCYSIPCCAQEFLIEHCFYIKWQYFGRTFLFYATFLFHLKYIELHLNQIAP